MIYLSRRQIHTGEHSAAAPKYIDRAVLRDHHYASERTADIHNAKQRMPLILPPEELLALVEA